MRWVGAVIGLALVVATSACDSDTTAPAGQPAEDVVQTLDPAEASKLKLGDTLRVVAELPQELDGDRVYFSSFASNGEVVGAVIPDDTDPAASGASAQSRPVMYDLEAKTFTVLDDGIRPEPTWVADVVGNEIAVVWVEGTDYNIGHSTFTIYAYDRATQKVAAIGAYDDSEGQIVYGNDLAIAGRTAYFSTATLPAKYGQESVFAIPVNGSASPRVLAAGGAQVRIDGDTLRYWVRNPKDEKEYPTHFTYDLKTGVTTPAPASAHADDDGFCGAQVTDEWETWCVNPSKRPGRAEERTETLLTIREASGRTTEFRQFPVGSFDSQIPHNVINLGRWKGISLPTDDGQQRMYLVDLDTREIQVFPDNTSFGPLSPNHSAVLVSSYAGSRAGPQRIVKIPTS